MRNVDRLLVLTCKLSNNFLAALFKTLKNIWHLLNRDMLVPVPLYTAAAAAAAAYKFLQGPVLSLWSLTL